MLRACLAVLFSAVLVLAQCPLPVLIPIRNVSLGNQQLRRGAALSVGTPPQSLVFQLERNYNNTILFDITDQCLTDNNAAQCETGRGAPQEARPNIVQDTWGSDCLALNATSSLPSFPLGINRLTELRMNTIGLGRNSSFLNALRQADFISSRTWGLLWGFAGIDTANQLDGSLVLGGYDAAKVTSANVTQSLGIDQGCESSMIVTVSDVTMNLPGNKNVSIMPAGRGSAMQAYAGDLTFTIGGLKWRIPNERLVVPEYTIDSQGQVGIANDSVREVLINPLFDVNKNDMPILGQPFLSSSYLLVDNDRQSFTLWRNNPTTEQRLVSVGAASSACPSKTNDTDDLRSASAASPQVSPTARKSTPIPAIVGAVLGSLVALSCIAAVMLLLLRRKQRHAAAAAAADCAAADDVESPLYPRMSHMYKVAPAELSHNAPAAQELDHGMVAQGPVELPSNAEVARMMPTMPQGYK